MDKEKPKIRATFREAWEQQCLRFRCIDLCLPWSHSRSPLDTQCAKPRLCLTKNYLLLQTTPTSARWDKILESLYLRRTRRVDVLNSLIYCHFITYLIGLVFRHNLLSIWLKLLMSEVLDESSRRASISIQLVLNFACAVWQLIPKWAKYPKFHSYFQPSSREQTNAMCVFAAACKVGTAHSSE